MYLDPAWRIMVVGDGDLSFSAAVATQYQPRQLFASIYDSHAQLAEKYGDNFWQKLQTLAQQSPITLATQFDVTDTESWLTLGQNLNQFDVVIFQFPLVPGYTNKAEFEANGKIDSNLRNRRLLHQFLTHAWQYGLDPKGAGVIYISSKDVKPYSEWDIEHSLHLNTELVCVGKIPFSFDAFPDYQMRNVDRDKFVKATASFTYIWRAKQDCRALPSAITEQLILPQQRNNDANICYLCQAGPFHSEQEQREHLKSKRHLKLQGYQQRWLADLGLISRP